MKGDGEPGDAAVVLAAGLGRRFGATKQLAEVDGRPLVTHAIATALDAAVDEVVVVLGHDAERVRRILPEDPRVRSVVNPDPAEGLSASLRCGVAALGPDVDRLVVLLADQPGIDPVDVRRVLQAVEGHEAARTRYRDGAGHPVAFARSVFGRLQGLEGDAGARELLEDLATSEVEADRDRPPDVDTPGDLASAEEDLDDHAGDHDRQEERRCRQVPTDDLPLPTRDPDGGGADGDVDG